MNPMTLVLVCFAVSIIGAIRYDVKLNKYSFTDTDDKFKEYKNAEFSNDILMYTLYIMCCTLAGVYMIRDLVYNIG